MKTFCPFCKSELIEKNGIFYCELGSAEFSLRATELIKAGMFYSVGVNESSLPNNGSYYSCPGCMSELVDIDDGMINCSDCGFKTKAILGHVLTEHMDHEPN